MGKEIVIFLAVILITLLLSKVDWVGAIFALASPVIYGVKGMLEDIFGLIPS